MPPRVLRASAAAAGEACGSTLQSASRPHTWSSTMTWQVEQARLPSHAPSSSTSFSCATCLQPVGGRCWVFGAGLAGQGSHSALQPTHARWRAAWAAAVQVHRCESKGRRRLLAGRIQTAPPAQQARPAGRVCKYVRTSRMLLPSGALTVFSLPSLSSLKVMLMLRVGGGGAADGGRWAGKKQEPFLRRGPVAQWPPSGDASAR